VGRDFQPAEEQEGAQAAVLTIVLAGAAIVGVFVPIRIVSDYVFWIMTAAYLIIVASTDLYRSGE
jgi:hypothetical protein